MKKIIPIFAFACFAISCNNSSDKQAEALQAQQKTVDSLNTEMVKTRTIDSMNAAAAQQNNVNNEQPPVVSRRHTTNNYTTNNNTTNGGYATTPEPQKKKGWSAKAKGAVIGTGVGAITGAMVDKKKGQGAVVGGLVGAAAGLGAGALIDNKNKNK